MLADIKCDVKYLLVVRMMWGSLPSDQGVTKRCRLSWLTNSALVYEPKCGGRRGWGWACWVSANEYSCAHGAQINLGDLTPYLTYANDKPEVSFGLVR